MEENDISVLLFKKSYRFEILPAPVRQVGSE